MCYDAAARPPHPPIAGGASDAVGRRLTLAAEDGNVFAAYSATTGTADGPGMVILPDVRGLHPFYEELALRLAEAGVRATAFDYFGRTAGLGERGEDFEYMPHVQQTTPDAIALDVRAAVDHLRSDDGGGASAVFTIGFCFGGRNSFNQAARGHGLAGVIGFYGFVAARGPDDVDAPVRLAGRYQCPVLGLFGGADRNITREAVGGFEHALGAAGIANEMVVYDGAPHSFFDRTFEQYRPECDDAWTRILSFVEANRA